MNNISELNQHLRQTTAIEKKLNDVIALRYCSYRNNHSISSNAEKTFYDDFDTKRNCFSHIEYIDSIPVAAIRGCVYDPNKIARAIPAMEIFSHEIEGIAGTNQVIVESNKFVIHPEFQRKAIKLKFELFAFIFNLALLSNASYIVTAVRESHIKFYKQMNFYPISEEKSYLGLDFKTVLLANNFNTSAESYLDLPDKIKGRLNIPLLAA